VHPGHETSMNYFSFSDGPGAAHQSCTGGPVPELLWFGEALTKEKKITLVQRNYKETLHIESTLINFFLST
jgi:hypothetical protein